MGFSRAGKDIFIQEGVSMEYQGIIITGTSGAGKSTIAYEFCKKFSTFQRVQAISTRKPRNDKDVEYKYLNRDGFEELEKNNKLLIKSEYRREKYGITIEDYQNVVKSNKIPVLVLTPESAGQFDESHIEHESFLVIFLDASENVLETRLTQRGVIIDENTRKRRDEDRKYKDKMWNRPKCPIYVIKNDDNVSLYEIAQLIYYIWEYRNIGGLIPKRLIELMVKCGMILENADLNNIQGASYDLVLGDEYFHKGEIKELSDRNPFIKMEPGDYVVASSREIANLPKDMAGRFDITVGLFCQGVILSNGPQIDPGFRGRLFCLLFNTSNKTIELKQGNHFATVEFIKSIENTKSYSGKYQNKVRMRDYLPSMVKASAINELREDVKKLKAEHWFLKILPIIISIFALVLVIYKLIGG